ncbi:sensor histidine kinase [Qaidamihabitans albus]|uniref:sensor histidine kinase n=1 Tax=Qaidamihabitans albus TaxID=2795733 RepID=UPI0027DCCE34|nr:histidine kinase [Qaidamihabitans albus]
MSRATYRRWVYLILGGAVLVPYVLFAAMVVPSLLPVPAPVDVAVLLGGLGALAVLGATSLLPAVRAIEATAVRELLDEPVPEQSSGGWPARLRAGGLFVAHVLVGGVVSFASLVLPILLALSVAVPFTGTFPVGTDGSTAMPTGWASAWLPAVLLLSVLLLFPVVAGSGALLARAARALLGLPVAERIALLQRQAEVLAERNRLARELHDSVGHALSVVSLQAGAARRTLRRQPDTAERALRAVEDSARAALEDLDHVLGLLREEDGARAPRAGLTELPALLTATREAGVAVDSEVHGEPGAVTPVVSREAYRILQECLTNALRHAGRVPVAVRVHVGAEELRLSVRNPLGTAQGGVPGGGRGLRGITERVELLRGEVRAGRDG